MDILSSLGAQVWSLLGYVVPFLFVLTIVVFVHEYGHYWVGRRCGVGVKAFSIGFGPELAGFNDRNGTRWRIAAIPLGGYVKFFGDANGASQPDHAAIGGMGADEREKSFFHKPVGQRAAVVAAGPIANFILAIAIFTLTALAYGRPVLTPRVEKVTEGSAAATAGLKPGDVVTSVNGRRIDSFAELQRIVSTSPGESLTLLVDREGRSMTLVATPLLKELKSPFGVQRIGLLGVQGSSDPADFRIESLGPVDALKTGVSETWFIVERTGAYIGGLFAGRESTDQLSGPIRIAQVSGHVAQNGIVALINLAALLSVSIGLINLFPIPMLDGGHLVFYAIEAVRGRPLSERAQEYGFRIGLAFVLMLMLFVTFNDILHLTTL
jgi:regulator of sigma E protease